MRAAGHRVRWPQPPQCQEPAKHTDSPFQLSRGGICFPRAFPSPIPHPGRRRSPLPGAEESPRRPFTGAGRRSPGPGKALFSPAPEGHFAFPAPPGLSEAAVAVIQPSRPAAFPPPAPAAARAASTAPSTGGAGTASLLPAPRCGARRGLGRPRGRRAQVRGAGRESGPRLGSPAAWAPPAR